MSEVPANVAGTFKGFHDLIGLQGVNRSTQAKQTVSDFLDEFLPAYADDAAPLPLKWTGRPELNPPERLDRCLLRR